MLAGFFALLGGLALIATVITLYQSLRAAFGSADSYASVAMLESDRRTALAEEKRALLGSIKDLEFERDSGKISEADFQRLNASLRERASEVLRLLDQDVEPFRAEAEKVLKAHLARAGVAKSYRQAAVRAARVAYNCPSCDTKNDPDATFCKRCGARVEPVDEAAPVGRKAGKKKKKARKGESRKKRVEAKATARAEPEGAAPLGEEERPDADGDEEAEASAAEAPDAGAAEDAEADASEEHAEEQSGRADAAEADQEHEADADEGEADADEDETDADEDEADADEDEADADEGDQDDPGDDDEAGERSGKET